MRQYCSKWSISLHKTICPICFNIGYMYVKSLFDGTLIFVISHKRNGVCYIGDI